MWIASLVLCFLFASVATVEGFSTFPVQVFTSRSSAAAETSNITPRTTTTTSLYITPPRKPRRALQKRRRKGDPNDTVEVRPFQNTQDDFPWETAESRPLIKAEAREQGEDYWIDEEELKKLEERSKPPVRQPGQVTDEKLWGEVLSPYRQNWIGLAWTLVLVFVVIGSQFPELMQSPVITIPDL